MAWSRILFLILSLFTSLPSEAQRRGGDGGHSGVARKQEAKVQSRWTLAEWLDQKKRNSLMDQWLAMNTSDNPYEFWLGGERLEQSAPDPADSTKLEKFTFNRGRAGAYASIIGIEGGYESGTKGWSGWDASLNLRLLGTAYQNTNLTLKGGARAFAWDDPDTSEEKVERWQLPFAGGQITLYVNRFFGLQGEYWYLFSEMSNQGRRMRGETSRGLLFIDFKWLRVFGGYSKDFLVIADEQIGRKVEDRAGPFGGLFIFF